MAPALKAPTGRQLFADSLAVHRQGKKSGWGKAWWPNGLYEGELLEDQLHGQGIRLSAFYSQLRGSFTWLNGSRYCGAWVMGRRSGQGCTTWADGRWHRGTYHQVGPWHLG